MLRGGDLPPPSKRSPGAPDGDGGSGPLQEGEAAAGGEPRGAKPSRAAADHGSDGSIAGSLRSEFPLVDPHRPPAAARKPAAARAVVAFAVVIALTLAGLLSVALGRAIGLWAIVPVGLSVVAASAWLALRASRVAPGARRRAQLSRARSAMPDVAGADERTIVLTSDTVDLERARGERISHPMVLPLISSAGGQRFGVTLLSNAKRDRLVAVLTSEAGTMLFATSFEESERPIVADLLVRSTVIGGDDHALDAVASDGAPTQLEPDVFAHLVGELGERDARCFERIILSDQHGALLLLEGTDLFANDHHFDLERPIEWRSILFQESFGSSVTLYQGTWVRQNGVEVVLVSLLGPSFFESQAGEEARIGDTDLDLRAMRDQRLLQATATDPPPNEQRVAIDGMFVLPVRAALDQAPRHSAQHVRSGHP